MKNKILLIILSGLFVFFSFYPSYYEIQKSNLIPAERTFTLEHNYLFDYNFYLSRIRQGLEGRWLVTEKYYHKPHQASLFQIFYLYLGQIGQILQASPPVVYHAARIIFGFLLLFAAGLYGLSLLGDIKVRHLTFWSAVAYLFLATLGSWPIIQIHGGSYRAATYMGWWSVMDSLQRITTIPHVLFGQLMLVLIIRRFSDRLPKLPKSLMWGLVGLITGIIFPPTLIIVYAVFAVSSILEFIHLVTGWHFRRKLVIRKSEIKDYLTLVIRPRLIFVLLSFPSFIYLQLMFKVQPWKALALFDIMHRMALPFNEYILALGPVFLLGMAGGLAVLIKGEKKLFPAVSWMAAIFILIKIFEFVPQQSPLRFTEALINVPAGILTAYFFYNVWVICGKLGRLGKLGKTGVIGVIFGVILTGLFVMYSMVGWLTDQVQWRREGTWLVAIGAQLIYPINDFMDGIYYLRDNTVKSQVVLGYVTSGNFIPAYAGNYVYIGHANTPDEDTKELKVADFFRGRMSKEEASTFLKNEHISYIFYGPQEKAFSNIEDFRTVYPNLKEEYTNPRVRIYKVISN